MGRKVKQRPRRSAGPERDHPGRREKSHCSLKPPGPPSSLHPSSPPRLGINLSEKRRSSFPGNEVGDVSQGSSATKNCRNPENVGPPLDSARKIYNDNTRSTKASAARGLAQTRWLSIMRWRLGEFGSINSATAFFRLLSPRAAKSCITNRSRLNSS